MKKFWFIWSPQGASPSRQHQTLEQAENEANRLCGNNPQRDFYILEATAHFRATSVVRTELE